MFFIVCYSKHLHFHFGKNLQFFFLDINEVSSIKSLQNLFKEPRMVLMRIHMAMSLRNVRSILSFDKLNSRTKNNKETKKIAAKKQRKLLGLL